MTAKDLLLRFADVASVITQHHFAGGELVGGPHNRQTSCGDPLGDRRRANHELSNRLMDVPLLEFFRAGQTVASAQQDGWRNPFHNVAHVAARQRTAVNRRQRGIDRAARIVAENDHKWHVQHRDRVFNRAQHRRIDDMSGCTDDEHVAQPLVKNDLRSHPTIGAAEDHRGRLLASGQARPMFDTLTGMLRATVDESLVTLFECFPCGDWGGVGHVSHSAAPTRDRLPTHPS